MTLKHPDGYQYSTTVEGLDAYLAEQHRKRAERTEAKPEPKPPTEKPCNDCERVLPATLKYFYPAPTNADRLTNKCRKCTRSKYRKTKRSDKPDRSPGLQVCKKCQQRYPATRQHFAVARGNKNNLSGKCKKCKKAEDRARYQQKKEQAKCKKQRSS